MENAENVGIEWLKTLLNYQGIAAGINASRVEDEFGASYWLTIDAADLLPEQLVQLVGERGHSLDAIQYLANTILNLGRSPDEQQPYTIELAGHRAKRKAELMTIVTEAADKAQSTGEECELAALSSAERRQVHHFFTEIEGLETFSRGREPDRRLVVRQSSQPAP